MEQADRFEMLIRSKETVLPWNLRDRAIENLPGVPVVAETLLKLELELHGTATDLREFSDAVLGDVGATIQVLRLAGLQYGAEVDRPLRIEDCISDLGPRACLNAIAKGSVLRGVRQHASSQFWSHAKEVAQYFRIFAGQLSSGIRPDQAYLAGLLHALGALPAILQWGQVGSYPDPARAALAMAEGWHLPAFLRDFFSEVLMPGKCPEWSNFITIAHLPAKESWVDCPLVAAPLQARLAAFSARWR